MKEKMKKLNDCEVHILKMKESSGNEQFYVRLVRTDEKKIGSILEYECFQTKFLEKNECLERAWFSASMVARFCGLSSMNEVIIQSVTDEEKEVMKNAISITW